jgi:hypothetical protein
MRLHQRIVGIQAPHCDQRVPQPPGEPLVPTISRSTPDTALPAFYTVLGRGVPAASARPACPASANATRRACRGGREPGLGGEHEPAVVLAIAGHPQLDLLTWQARLLHVPATPAGYHRPVGFQPRRVPKQDAVLEPQACKSSSPMSYSRTCSTTASGNLAV